ncbi:MAG: hypothetical protein OXH03_12665 [Bacteroidetes bacterium]|nr:hypothetical protein [Bacteroidota bacterium]
MSSLEDLSPTDFEILCHDLAEVRAGKRVEALGPSQMAVLMVN